jgi:hypothetical protein
MNVIARTRIVGIGLVAVLAAVVAQDLVRTDVSALRDWISHLSLGPYGWLNVVVLMLGGLAVLALTPTIRSAATSRRVSRWASRWTALAGIGLIAAGLFVADAPPGGLYPPTTSWHGTLHDVAGGLVFLGLFASCLTTRKLLSPLGGVACAVIIAVGWVVASGLAAVGYATPGSNLPSGLAERLAFFTGVGWLAALAVRLGQPGRVERGSG